VPNRNRIGMQISKRENPPIHIRQYARGKVAKEPHVPGAFGRNPVPNQWAIRHGTLGYLECVCFILACSFCLGALSVSANSNFNVISNDLQNLPFRARECKRQILLDPR